MSDLSLSLKRASVCESLSDTACLTPQVRVHPAQQGLDEERVRFMVQVEPSQHTFIVRIVSATDAAAAAAVAVVGLYGLSRS